MSDDTRRRATYDDVLAAPAQVVAELVHGVLHTQACPAGAHSRAGSVLGMDIGGPFDRGRGGPGGWIILNEPELHFGEHVLVPDLAGWRRTRLPNIDGNSPYFTLMPDWVCEVLSPSTTAFDRAEKLPLYAEAGVAHAWLVDPLALTLEVLRREGAAWLLLATWRDDVGVRAEPFDAIELALGALWADLR